MTAGRRIDIKALTKGVAQSTTGLAPKTLAKKIRPGAVFTVHDDAIQFPTEGLPGEGARTRHEVRWAIVVQCHAQCASARPKTLLVVPCTSSAAGVDHWEFEIPPGEEGFTKDTIVALAHLLQPIRKSDLVEYKGDLEDKTLQELRGVIARNLGLVAPPSVQLPPREK